MQSTEEWRSIPGYEGRYEASSAGRIRSTGAVSKGGRILSPVMIRQYKVVNLFSSNGVRAQTKVHRAVCAAFHGQSPSRESVVRHLNGDPLDNRPTNLAWGTDQENNTDTVLHGRNKNAARSHCARGHDYTPENTRIVIGESGRPHRQCRACGRIWAAKARAARKRPAIDS